jgi:hypothetical protein
LHPAKLNFFSLIFLTLQGPSGLSGPIVQQSFRAVGMVIDRITDIALQMAPEEASPTAVRAAVSGGLILLSLSFVKGILSVSRIL